MSVPVSEMMAIEAVALMLGIVMSCSICRECRDASFRMVVSTSQGGSTACRNGTSEGAGNCVDGRTAIDGSKYLIKKVPCLGLEVSVQRVPVNGAMLHEVPDNLPASDAEDVGDKSRKPEPWRKFSTRFFWEVMPCTMLLW